MCRSKYESLAGTQDKINLSELQENSDIFSSNKRFSTGNIKIEDNVWFYSLYFWHIIV